MVTSIIGTVASEVESFSQPPCLAKRLGPAERRDLALEVLAGKEPLSHLAERCGVSRNFLRGLRQKGREAVEQAVAESPQDEERVLYYIPVNKRWIRQVVLAQVLIGHSSYRAVGEIAEAVLDYRGLSLGKVHQIVTDALPQAREPRPAKVLRPRGDVDHPHPSLSLQGRGAGVRVPLSRPQASLPIARKSRPAGVLRPCGGRSEADEPGASQCTSSRTLASL